MAKIKERLHELHPTVVKRHRKDGDYCEIIVRFFDPDQGKYRTVSQRTDIIWNETAIVHDKVKEQYGRRLKSKVEAILSGEAPDKKEDITFADYMDLWLQYREEVEYKLNDTISEDTLLQNKSAVAVIQPYFIRNPILLSRIREEHIYGFERHLREQGHDNNYIRIKLDKMDQILSRAVKEKYIEKNPFDYIDKPRRDQPEEQPYLTVEQLKTLLERVKGHDIEPLVYILVYLGVRIGEALGITWDCVDFNNNNIIIEKQARKKNATMRLKTKRSYRKLKMPSALRDYLLDLKEQPAKDREFCGNCYREPEIDVVVRKWNGWNLQKNQWRAKFRKFMSRQLDLPYITPKGLCKSFNVAQQEADISDIIRAKNMGHTVDVNNKYYSDVRDEKAAEAMET